MLWKALLLAVAAASASAQEINNRFPDGFMLGYATAAYQVEGAWNEDGKGESIWDHMLHEHPDWGWNGQNGDVACDSYHKYPVDVECLVNASADMYRFSISWPRVLPTGDLDNINQAGIDYYNNLIDLLLANNIQPLVTMYHWDLPQALQYIGGWPNPIMADYFVEYARLLFDTYGDRVKWWITFNEPTIFAGGYTTSGGTPPSQNAPGIGDYLTYYTVINAHARVWHLYNDTYRATQQGRVGIVLNSEWHEPQNASSPEDQEASERMMQFVIGAFGQPLFSPEGDWPAVMKERIDANSAAEGRPRSRLPAFTQQEIEYNRGTTDFIGLNTYATNLVTLGETGTIPSKAHDQGVIISYDPNWIVGASGYVYIVPWGFRKLLNWLSNAYPQYPIMVTENGFSDWGETQDDLRMTYHGHYMAELLNAINVDGNNIIGYMAWSIIDNLEWTQGFRPRWGVYRVDIDDPDLPRTPKASLELMNGIYTSRTVPLEYFNSTVFARP
ncbi:myrosinase 1-like [Schistocerca americana]|uniref:myrosinase 1-like n=1 Tax=Schistocerca americana TaxID=7009 RepID=UPI001F4F13B7|nr:myrosinase 1-like [Schistocerca americana]